MGTANSHSAPKSRLPRWWIRKVPAWVMGIIGAIIAGIVVVEYQYQKEEKREPSHEGKVVSVIEEKAGQSARTKEELARNNRTTMNSRAVQKSTDPLSVEAYYNAASAAEKEGDYDGAIAFITRAIEIDPNKAESYVRRGYIHREARTHIECKTPKETIELAIDDYTRAIRLDPRCDGAYSGRAICYEIRWDRSKDKEYKEYYAKAIEGYTKAIEINPKNAEHWASRGMFFRHAKRFTEAIDDLNKAIELAPNDWQHYWYRSSIYRDLKKNNMALTDLAKALEFAHNDGAKFLVYETRFRFYRDLHEHDMAVRDLTKLIELELALDAFVNVVWYCHRAQEYAELQEYDKAIADLNKAISLDAFYMTPWAVSDALSKVYATVGNNASAEAVRKQLRDLKQIIRIRLEEKGGRGAIGFPKWIWAS